MKIKSLTLFSNDLDSQKSFYSTTLGFKILDETSSSFVINVGWTKLKFQQSPEKYHYHYCFLLPSNQFESAYHWFENHLDIIQLDGESMFDFEGWNAKSFYFYDGNNNVAECIVRYDLKNPSTPDFSISSLLCVNEIGMPSSNIRKQNETLEKSINSQFWKGNFERFATNGDEEGLFLLVKNDIKKIWFPTRIPTQVSPFEAEIESNEKLYELTYSNEILNANQKVLVP